MKTLIISDLWTPFPGGAERFIANMGNELLKRGHEIHVFTSYAPAKGDIGINLVYKSVPVNENRPAGLAILDAHVRALEPDLILTHHFFAYHFEDRIFSYPIPVVQLVHSAPRIQRARLAVFNSQFTARAQGARSGDMVMLPPAYPNVVAATHGSAIGMVKPIHHKGIDYFYRIAQHYPDRKFLVLRGEWQNNEDIRHYPNVSFMEPVNDIREFYSQCRMTLMPSWTEEAGTIPQESALNGIPCISTNVGGLPETNVGGIVLERNELLWHAEIERLDDPEYYRTVTERQSAAVAAMDWNGKFDELDGRMRQFDVESGGWKS